MPCSMDYSSTQLNQRFGPDYQLQVGSHPCKKAWKAKRQAERRGRCSPKSPSEASLPEEAKSKSRACRLTKDIKSGDAEGYQFSTGGCAAPRFQAADSHPAGDSSKRGYDEHAGLNSSPTKSWDDLQDFSFGAWCSQLYSAVLGSRTAFARFLNLTFQARPSGSVAAAGSLFPLPAPRCNLGVSKTGGSPPSFPCHGDGTEPLAC